MLSNDMRGPTAELVCPPWHRQHAAFASFRAHPRRGAPAGQGYPTLARTAGAWVFQQHYLTTLRPLRGSLNDPRLGRPDPCLPARSPHTLTVTGPGLSLW